MIQFAYRKQSITAAGKGLGRRLDSGWCISSHQSWRLLNC